MADTLIITKRDEQTIWMAALSGTHATDLRIASASDESTSLVGNIYIGKVRKVQKNIDAAFIEIADRQQCYCNIAANPDAIYTKKGNSKKIAEGDELLVQVIRDGLKTKLPALSGNLELPGQYLVLTGNDSRIGISGKLSQSTKERLKEWMKPFAREKYGFIVRTNAGEASREEIEAEAKKLEEQYLHLLKTAPYRTCFSALKTSESVWIEMLRNTYTADLTSIITDDPQIYNSLEHYLKENDLQNLSKLRLYQDDLLPLYKLCRLEREIDLATSRQVWLKSGGYLVIDPTEALTVIDVNTGKYSGKKLRRETLKTINLEAAKEAARQIRLRNLSGIILIDFINMENKEDQKELLAFLESRLFADPVKTRLIDMTKLELVEITRKKVHKTLKEQIAALESEKESLSQKD